MGRNAENLNQPTISAEHLRLLEKLCNAVAVSGNEGEVRHLVMEQIKPYVHTMQIDALGNLLVYQREERSKPLTVMIAAHMDEVGFMLTSEEDKEEGIFRFELVGGIDPHHLAGKTVQAGKGRHKGVIGCKAIHLTTPEERRSSLSIEGLRVDFGGGGRAKVGDWGTFTTPFQKIGGSVRAKALDNRLGVAIAMELLKYEYPELNLVVAFTVQEEVGLRGAKVAAYALNPDIAVVLDCTPAYDLPLQVEDSFYPLENERYNTRLGRGAAIYLSDRATISDPRLVAHFVRTAEEHQIPYQFRQAGGGSTDAGTIHLQRAGIPTLSISVPGRYLHTSASLARISDWESTLRLVYFALQTLPVDILQSDR
ncbi:MAG: M20/M25/M40 family metallo-hydrolase [Anaerolineales bacterium]|nr:M20/M25/M40 family metallo-hydrolase [Anaerolineales bacterium]MDW8161394.1 M20/M25/M40 family metallo-hydrolase [Anaerolineales bacterium]